MHLYNGNQYIEGAQGAGVAINYTSFSRLIFNTDHSNTNRGPNKITLYDDGVNWYAGFGIHSDIIGYYSGSNHVWYKSTSQTTSTEYMRLSSTGNLGIGTTNPGSKLQINVSSATGIVINGTGGYANIISQGGHLEFYKDGTPTFAAAIGLSTPATALSNDIQFATYNGSSWSARMTIQNGGNVGIGTTSPAFKLHVANGDITIANGNQTSGDFSQAQSLHFLNETTTPLATIKAVRTNWAQGQTDLTFSTYNSGMGEKMRITSAGNVGIGTTSPSQLLELSGTSAALRIISTSGDAYIRLTDNGVRNWDLKVVDVSDYFQIGGTSATSLIVTGAGNVGVGTTSPSYKLDVYSDTNTEVGRFYNNATSCNFYIGSTNNTAGTDIILYTSTGNAQFFKNRSTTSWGGADSLNIYTSNGAIAFHPAGTTNAVYIANNGNLGIGTTSPNTLLNVHGADPFVRINNTSANNQGIKISYNNSDTHGLHLLYNANSAVSYIDNTYPVNAGYVYGDIYFRQNVAGTMTTRMTIKADGGNVGIGTTSPAAKLDVVGNIQAEGLLGKLYTASGATIDTGITADSFNVLEVIGTVNPNSGGSGAYKDPVHIFIYNGAGWNGSAVTQYIYSNQLAPLAREVFDSGSSSSGNVIEAVWLTGSTESDSCPITTSSSYQVRLKISNYNSTYGSNFSVRIIKRY